MSHPKGTKVGQMGSISSASKRMHKPSVRNRGGTGGTGLGGKREGGGNREDMDHTVELLSSESKAVTV